MEVCGLKWTTDGRFLASGSNDNSVCIWNLPAAHEPVHQLMEHKSAVKVYNYVADIFRILVYRLWDGVLGTAVYLQQGAVTMIELLNCGMF